MADRIAWLRILGHGDSSGLYLYHTGAIPGGWSGPSYGTAIPALLTVPTAFGQKIKPLDLLSSDSSITVDLLWEGQGQSTAVRELVRGTATPAEAGGRAVRVTGYHTASATTINLTDTSGISASDLLWIPSTGEVLTVASVPTGTTVDVTGGRGALGTNARPIPGGGLIAPPVYDGFPGPVGMFCEVGYDSTTLFRGIVDGVTATDGTRVSLSLLSLTSALRKLRFQSPGAQRPVQHADLTIAGARLLSRDITSGSGYIEVDADAYGDSGDARWTHAVFSSADSDAWCVVEVSYVDTDTTRTPSVARYTTNIEDDGGGILAIGDGQRIIEYDDAFDRNTAIRQILRGACNVSWAYVDATSPDVAGILSDLLTRYEPIGTGAGLPSSWVDTSAIGDGSQIGSVPALAENTSDPDTGDPAFALPPQKPDRKLVDVISDHLLRPAFVGLGMSRTGAIATIDWAWDDITATALTGADTAGAGYAWQVDSTNATPVVLLRRSADTIAPELVPLTVSTGVEVSVRYGTVTTQDYSIIASDTLGPGVNIDPLTIDVYVDRRGFAEREDRARDIVTDYGRALPILGMTLRGTSLSVGDRVTVSRADLPQSAGDRGAAALSCIVLEQTTDTASGVQAVALLVFGWFDGDWGRAIWSPAAEVTAWSDPTATVQANAFTATAAPTGSGYPTSDAESFADAITAGGGSVVVDICDADGTRRGTATCTAAGSNTLTLSGATTTPANGDLIVLASPGEQSAGVSDWMLGTLALLGNASGQVSSTDVSRWR